MIQMKWYNSIQFKLQFFICLVFILSVGAILVNNYINDKNNLGHSLKTSDFHPVARACTEIKRPESASHRLGDMP